MNEWVSPLLHAADVEAAGMAMTYAEQQQRACNHESWFSPFLFEGDIILKHLENNHNLENHVWRGSNFPAM